MRTNRQKSTRTIAQKLSLVIDKWLVTADFMVVVVTEVVIQADSGMAQFPAGWRTMQACGVADGITGVVGVGGMGLDTGTDTRTRGHMRTRGTMSGGHGSMRQWSTSGSIVRNKYVVGIVRVRTPVKCAAAGITTKFKIAVFIRVRINCAHNAVLRYCERQRCASLL